MDEKMTKAMIDQIDQAVDTLITLLDDIDNAAKLVARGPGGREVALAKARAEEVGHRLRDAIDVIEK